MYATKFKNYLWNLTLPGGPNQPWVPHHPRPGRLQFFYVLTCIHQWWPKTNSLSFQLGWPPHPPHGSRSLSAPPKTHPPFYRMRVKHATAALRCNVTSATHSTHHCHLIWILCRTCYRFCVHMSHVTDMSHATDSVSTPTYRVFLHVCSYIKYWYKN